MKAIIVTGSRYWSDQEALWSALDRVWSALDRVGDCVLIHGDARGADKAAEYWARERSSQVVEVIAMPAQWDRDRKSAGPQRNQRMLDVLLALRACGYDVEVHAFPLPDSRGTWDMVNRAKAAGVHVLAHEVPA